MTRSGVCRFCIMLADVSRVRSWSPANSHAESFECLREVQKEPHALGLAVQLFSYVYHACQLIKSAPSFRFSANPPLQLNFHLHHPTTFQQTHLINASFQQLSQRMAILIDFCSIQTNNYTPNCKSSFSFIIAHIPMARDRFAFSGGAEHRKVASRSYSSCWTRATFVFSHPNLLYMLSIDTYSLFLFIIQSPIGTMNLFLSLSRGSCLPSLDKRTVARYVSFPFLFPSPSLPHPQSITPAQLSYTVGPYGKDHPLLSGGPVVQKVASRPHENAFPFA